MFERRQIFISTGPIKRSIWGPMLPFLAILFLLIGQLITIIPVVEMGLVSEDEMESYPNIIYMLFAPFLAMIFLNAFIIYFFEGRTLASIGVIKTGNSFKQYISGYGYGLLMALIIVCGIWGLGGYELESSDSFQFSDFVPHILLILAFIVQAGAEEYLFRGWLFSRLAERYNVFVGIAINAGIFVLVHLPGVDFANTTAFLLMLEVIMTVLFSVFLSLIVLKQRSIWGAAAWHAAWNWFFISVFGLATTGIELGLKPLVVDLKAVETAPIWMSGGLGGPEVTVATVVVLTLGCVLVAKNKILK
jgi:membrane protease YdiL (CAAX protease family)